MARYVVIISVITEVIAYAMIDPFNSSAEWKDGSEEKIQEHKTMRKIGIVLAIVTLIPLILGLRAFYGN